MADDFHYTMEVNPENGHINFVLLTNTEKAPREIPQEIILEFFKEHPDPCLTKKKIINALVAEKHVSGQSLDIAFKALLESGKIAIKNEIRIKNAKHYILNLDTKPAESC